MSEEYDLMEQICRDAWIVIRTAQAMDIVDAIRAGVRVKWKAVEYAMEYAPDAVMSALLEVRK